MEDLVAPLDPAVNASTPESADSADADSLPTDVADASSPIDSAKSCTEDDLSILHIAALAGHGVRGAAHA